MTHRQPRPFKILKHTSKLRISSQLSISSLLKVCRDCSDLNRTLLLKVGINSGSELFGLQRRSCCVKRVLKRMTRRNYGSFFSFFFLFEFLFDFIYVQSFRPGIDEFDNFYDALKAIRNLRLYNGQNIIRFGENGRKLMKNIVEYVNKLHSLLLFSENLINSVFIQLFLSFSTRGLSLLFGCFGGYGKVT